MTSSARILSTLVLASVLGFAGVAHAQEDQGFRVFNSFTFSGSAALTSDYVFRGITQNDEKPAVQLGLELAHDSGAYVALWGSQVDFNDGGEADVEVDAILGYGFESGPWSADVNYTHYFYPGADDALDYEYGEFIFTGGYDFDVAALGASFAYSPDYFGDTGHAEYIQATLDVPLPRDFSAHASIGKQYVEDNARLGTSDAVDWKIGLGYTYSAFDFDLSYTDTDLSKGECPDGCSGRVVGTVAFNF